ncbi:helicase C-terminal domain-containing protein [Favolaschia claudopus]|uniref:Helicase C-terminal domain-containing protein n=1 Tax=Favolaschia claudopus TaxID=2862362 RepID=A0AAW0CDW5_9AGAR
MDDPWNIENYLSYGVLLVPIQDGAELRHEVLGSNAILAKDNWLDFPGSSPLFFKYLRNSEDHTVLHELEYLILHKFVFASFALVDSKYLLLRIYLVPYDLPGVQGRLRSRRDDIVGQARRSLISLLPKLSQDPDCWEGRRLPDPPSIVPGTTLSGLYEALPSPLGEVTATSTPVTKRLLNFSDRLENLGFRTTLHRYQRRSVAAMVQKEMDLTNDPDPMFLPVVGFNNRQFFFQPGTMELLLERRLVAPCRAGILCEELGTGKTVMILGLILATIHQISEPEPSIIDPRPVLTPIALRHFPSDTFAAARQRFPGRKSKHGVPKLVELLMHKMATSPVTLVPEARAPRYAALQEAVDDLEHYSEPRKQNLPFYLDYAGEPIDNERINTRRASAQDEPRLLYLTSATLVVVPANLLLQWTSECSLHCEDSLRRCILQKNDRIPPARELASQYDIVLMSYPRFTAENVKTTDLTWRICRCPEFPGVRVPKCVCKGPACSPLLQIRWKRLVIDEGHVSASLTTALTPFVKTLSVERRWIVTGTPTTNLLGLSLGKKDSEGLDMAPGEASEDLSNSSRAASEGPETAQDDDDALTAAPVPRIWTKDDGEDLKRLGNMITHFVGVPQLLANPQLFTTQVKNALLDKRGPRFGATEVLTQVMSSVMFRHRIADVEEEVKLPPVTQELVLLDLEPMAVKSYNALQAVLAINAVSSQRTDKDYMFHPSNAAALQEAVQNMSQLMFWMVDDNCYNATEALRNSEKTVKKLPSTTSDEDKQLLETAYHHLRVASEDPLWRTLQGNMDVPYRVSELERPIFEAWTRTKHTLDPDSSAPSCGFIHSDRLRALRNIVLSKPLISKDGLVEAGIQTAEEEAKQKAELDALKRKKSSRNYDEKPNQIKATQVARKATDPNMVKEVQKELATKVAVDFDSPRPQANIPHVPRPSALVAKSHIANTQVGCSASSKLNFVVQVLKYSADEKFLIFSGNPLSLAYINEALELIGVDCLQFTTQIDVKVREQFVLTFETSEKYRVFLMELKHGARGLNLVSASRVIFCEPVWRADVESQAIKRCHRIGQTRSITVKTMAIRGTAEENMAGRRLALKNSTEKIPNLLINESGMRSFIANPKFITYDSESPELPLVEFPLVKLPPPADDEDVLMTEGDVEPLPRQVHFSVEDDGPSSPRKRRLESSLEESTPQRKKKSPRGQKVRLVLREPSSEIQPTATKSKMNVRFA